MSIDPSSYRIDEEESVDDGTADENDDDNKARRRIENEDLTRLNTVTVADQHHHLRNGDQPRLTNLQHGNNSNNSSSISSSNSNAAAAATVPQQRPDDSVAITVSPCLKYVELQRPDDDTMVRNQNTKPEKLSFFQKLYNPNKSNSPANVGNSISRFDGEEDDEFTPINKEQNNIKITPTKYLPNKTKQKPNDEEELRPLSNGYVVQNS